MPDTIKDPSGSHWLCFSCLGINHSSSLMSDLLSASAAFHCQKSSLHYNYPLRGIAAGTRMQANSTACHRSVDLIQNARGCKAKSIATAPHELYSAFFACSLKRGAVPSLVTLPFSISAAHSAAPTVFVKAKKMDAIGINSSKTAAIPKLSSVRISKKPWRNSH